MSADSESSADEVCASCGKAAVDNIKLKLCTACKVVKYCSVDCQKNHRKQHKKECKKRAAEIRENNLFKQPDECCLGECPICCLPLPLGMSKFAVTSCCCKMICRGCSHANQKRELEQGLEPKCTFCREPIMKPDEEIEKDSMKRVKANEPVAMTIMGSICEKEGDLEGAFQYWTKAAELGNMEAHYNLSRLYADGQGVERDLKKKVYHLEEAAIGGHPYARYNLGNHEFRNGRTGRATKHYIIAAKLGHDDALECVKKDFVNGYASKEDYEAALRGHQAAMDATKSEQREEAYAFFEQTDHKRSSSQK